MATHSSIFAWKIPQREAWQATVPRVAKSRTWLSTNNVIFLRWMYFLQLEIPGTTFQSVFLTWTMSYEPSFIEYSWNYCFFLSWSIWMLPYLMCRNLFWGCLSFQLLWDLNVTDFKPSLLRTRERRLVRFFHYWLLRPFFMLALGWESLKCVPAHKEPMIWKERSVYSISGKKIWPKHCVGHLTYFPSDSPNNYKE